MNRVCTTYILLLALVLCSCSKGEGNGSTTPGEDIESLADSAALRVAVTPTIDCMPLFLAADHGFFANEGIDVRLLTYQAQMDCDTAMLHSRVDAMTTDMVRAKRMTEQGKPLRLLGPTALHWQLITGRTARIRQLSQMDDKMMAMTRYSATSELAASLIDSAGLDPDRVFLIQVNDVSVRLDMMLTGTMDAALMPEPQATAARLAGHASIYDTRLAGRQMGVVTFSDSALRADTMRRAQLPLFVKAYNKACDSLNAPNALHRYRDILITRTKIKPQVADTLAIDSLIHFPKINM